MRPRKGIFETISGELRDRAGGIMRPRGQEDEAGVFWQSGRMGVWNFL